VSEISDETVATRILVALDVSPPSLAILELAISLAARLHAELIALYIEDINLLRLTGLPFVRQVDRLSATALQWDDLQMARALRLQMQQIQQVLHQIPKEVSIRSSLQVVRGHYLAEALAAGEGVDILFLGKSGKGSTKFPGLPGRHAGRGPGGSQRPTRAWPIWVLYDGSPAGRRALLMAAELGCAAGMELVVLIASATLGEAERLRANAARILAERSAVAGSYRLLQDAAGESLPLALKDQGCSLLILLRGAACASAATAQALLEEVGCPMVLVA
jgi:nucleotide-binding universal stress UspA family protein